MPVGERPILDIVLRQLKHFGFEHVTIVTGHLAELIEAYAGDGSRYGLLVDYYREDEPLGTVGALALLDGLDAAPFMVMNGDVLTDLDYGRIMARHRDSAAVATIATRTQNVQVSLGVMHFGDEDDRDRVTDYVEKPTLHYESSMGVYCFDPSVLPHIEPNVRLDFPDLVLRLVGAGELVRADRSDDFWLDIGQPDDYEQAQDDIERLYDRLLPGG